MKFKFFFALILLVCSLSLIGCSPSEEAIQLALAQTQTAMATNTYTPEPTATFTPEPTFTSTPTSTQTSTPTPDLRVITIESKEFLLTKDDLPEEAKYFLPNSTWISPHLNYEIISGWGREEGLAYLDETGRIEGWWVAYKRGTSTVRAPEEIYHNIIQYESAEGAYLTLNKYSRREIDSDFSLVDIEVLLGDETFIYIRKIMQPSGEYRTTYIIETQYRNYVSIVNGWGWDKDFDLDYVINIAEIALAKLEDAPLGNR